PHVEGPRERAGRRLRVDLPADLRVRSLRPGLHYAQVAAGLREQSARVRRRTSDARAADRGTNGDVPVEDARVGRRVARGVHPTVGVAVPQDVTVPLTHGRVTLALHPLKDG